MIRDCDSIQGALEAAFSTILPKQLTRPVLVTSSRTDSGVHAFCNAAHVELENKYGLFDRDTVLKYVNRYLIRCRHTIRLFDFLPVTEEFHARRSAISRTYVYRFMVPKDYAYPTVPVSEMYSCHNLRVENFDVERVKRATQLFMGLKDFRTFSAETPGKEPRFYLRNLTRLSVEKGDPLMPLDPLCENFDFWNVTCSSRAFLYNQVRRIVGSLLTLGVGKITEKDITVMLQVPGHRNWNPKAAPVPPHGLFLTKLEYDPDDLERCIIKDTQKDANIK